MATTLHENGQATTPSAPQLETLATIEAAAKALVDTARAQAEAEAAAYQAAFEAAHGG